MAQRLISPVKELLTPSHPSGQFIAHPQPLCPDSHLLVLVTLNRSAALMLTHLGYDDAAKKLDLAVDAVIRRGDVLTPDLGGNASTEEVTSAVINEL